MYGGNESGSIDPGDSVWESLLLWTDSNHDGLSSANEIRTLAETDVEEISLRYHWTGRHDKYGNEFRYKAKLTWRKPAGGGSTSYIYDIFFLRE